MGVDAVTVCLEHRILRRNLTTAFNAHLKSGSKPSSKPWRPWTLHGSHSELVEQPYYVQKSIE